MSGNTSKICPKCETENRDSAKFCDECGTPLVKQVHEEKYYDDEEGGFITPKKIGAIVVIIIIIAVLYIFLTQHGIGTINKTTTTSPTTSISAPVFNPTYGNDYIADIEFSSNTVLVGDISTEGSITIDKGVALTTNGYNLISNNIFDNLGIIYTGSPENAAPLGVNGQSYLNSYGGSGGSGGGGGGSAVSGSTPQLPKVTTQQIQEWYANGMINYLTGAGGGGGCPYNGYSGNGGSTLVSGGIYKRRSTPCAQTGGTGGSGSYGVYIQAHKLISGIVNASGQVGQPGVVDGGGGGGGGMIVLAYGSGGFTQGNYNVNGGSVQQDSGAGGTGRILAFNYGSTPPITPP